MALTYKPPFIQTAKIGVVQTLNADGTNNKTVVTAGSNGTKVVSLTASSTDTSNRIFQVQVSRSGTDYILCTVTVPAASGTDGTTASVDLLNSTILPGLPADNDGQRYLFLQSGDTLTVKCTTTVTSGKIVSFASVEADF
jgi:hypothetical protein